MHFYAKRLIIITYATCSTDVLKGLQKKFPMQVFINSNVVPVISVDLFPLRDKMHCFFPRVLFFKSGSIIYYVNSGSEIVVSAERLHCVPYVYVRYGGCETGTHVRAACSEWDDVVSVAGAV